MCRLFRKRFFDPVRICGKNISDSRRQAEMAVWRDLDQYRLGEINLGPVDPVGKVALPARREQRRPFRITEFQVVGKPVPTALMHCSLSAENPNTPILLMTQRLQLKRPQPRKLLIH